MAVPTPPLSSFFTPVRTSSIIHMATDNPVSRLAYLIQTASWIMCAKTSYEEMGWHKEHKVERRKIQASVISCTAMIGLQAAIRIKTLGGKKLSRKTFFALKGSHLVFEGINAFTQPARIGASKHARINPFIPMIVFSALEMLLSNSHTKRMTLYTHLKAGLVPRVTPFINLPLDDLSMRVMAGIISTYKTLFAIAYMVKEKHLPDCY